MAEGIHSGMTEGHHGHFPLSQHMSGQNSLVSNVEGIQGAPDVLGREKFLEA